MKCLNPECKLSIEDHFVTLREWCSRIAISDGNDFEQASNKLRQGRFKAEESWVTRFHRITFPKDDDFWAPSIQEVLDVIEALDDYHYLELICLLDGLWHPETVPSDVNEWKESNVPEMAFSDLFELKEVIGHGGQGIVARAHQRSLNKDVAVKFFTPQTQSKCGKKNFSLEVTYASNMRHEGVLSPFWLAKAVRPKTSKAVSDNALREVATAKTKTGDAFFFVAGGGWGGFFSGAQVVEGATTMATWIGCGPTPGLRNEKQSLDVIKQIIDSMAEVHSSKPIAHLDLKPENILVDCDGRTFISDFFMPDSDAQFAGSLSHAAPEQFFGFRSFANRQEADVYALGILIFEIICRKPLFGGYEKDPAFNSNKALELRLRGGNISELETFRAVNAKDLMRIVGKCLEIDRVNRYQNAGMLRDDFERLLALKPLKHAGARGVRLKLVSPRDLMVRMRGNVQDHRSSVFAFLAKYKLYFGDMRLWKRDTVTDVSSQHRPNFKRIARQSTTWLRSIPPRMMLTTFQVCCTLGHNLRLFIRRERAISSLLTAIAVLILVFMVGLSISVQRVNSLNKVLEVKSKELQVKNENLEFQISEIAHRDVLRLKVALLRALEKSDEPEHVFGIMFVDSWFANYEEDQLRINDDSLFQIASVFAGIGIDWDNSGRKFPDGWEDSFEKALESKEEPLEARISVVSQMYFIARLAWFTHLVSNNKMDEAIIQLGELEKIRMRADDSHLSGVWPQLNRLTACVLVDCVEKFHGKESSQLWQRHFLSSLQFLEESKVHLILDRLFKQLLTSKYDWDVLNSIDSLVPATQSIANMNLRLSFAACLSLVYKCGEAKKQYELVLASKAEELDGSDADKASLLDTLTIAIYPSLTYLRDKELYDQLVSLQNRLLDKWRMQVEKQLDKHVDIRTKEEVRIKSTMKGFYDIASGVVDSDKIVEKIRELLDDDTPIARMYAVEFIAGALTRFEQQDVSKALKVLDYGLSCGFVEQDEFDTLKRKLESP